MITVQEKIELVNNNINRLDLIIKSFEENSEFIINKTNTQEELNSYIIQKTVLLSILEDLKSIVQEKGID
jgi:hypothetical protein